MNQFKGKKKSLYNGTNVLVILAAAAFFARKLVHLPALFSGFGLPGALILFVTVFLVHLLKGLRLYIGLYGENMQLLPYVKTYCKVTPVSMLLPFKLGEFFRMFCYGILIENPLKGIVIILLDRFMDTAALVCALLFVLFTRGVQATLLGYFLAAFLVLVAVLYFSFPGIYRFWNRSLLHARATETRLSLLRLLDTANRIYKEAESVVHGRGMILFFLSLLAWGAEIGGLLILQGAADTVGLQVLSYLQAAAGSGGSDALDRFVALGVVFLIVIYLAVKACELFRAKRKVK